MADEPLIAVFVDYENLAIGVRQMRKGKFQMELVVRRLLEKGRIVFKRAYCDWSNYRDAVRDFHHFGIELVDIPQSKASGKNSADIHMVVDALDLCHQKAHIDIFALVSGDSDFSPLAAKLKENDKRVIGCGVKASTSDLLIGSCDEFIYYDDLIRDEAAKPKRQKGRTAEPEDERLEDASEKVVEIVRSLERDYDPVWGSMVKQTIRRVYPGFNEGYYGTASFAELLERLQKEGRIELEFDENRGNYVVRTPGRKR
ncbi:MAG TPA: NYN domain-containing protein [Myxococcota bacterium]|nr:NYN domain-containing protein [Myxococcota bacterium]